MTYITRMKSACFKKVDKILERGDYSEQAVTKAVAVVVKFADSLLAKISKYEGYRGYEALTDDRTPMSLSVQTYGDAAGNHTLAQASVNASLLDFENCTIAIASATSVAASSPGGFASAASFSAVRGSDFARVNVETVNGPNYSSATERMFAVDFKFLKDLNILRINEKNSLVDEVATHGNGNVATATFDVVAKGENSYAEVIADTFALEDTFSSAAISADLFIA